MTIASFTPPRRILMGPGPSDVSERVRLALARPTVGHLDPAFVGMMEDVKTLLRGTFQSSHPFCLPLSAPASAAMEACLVNMLEPGTSIVVCENGVFGGRMSDIGRRIGANVIRVTAPWGRAIDPQDVRTTLRQHPEARLIAFVHAETSTGACTRPGPIAEVAREFGCLTLVDAVTSLGGCPLDVDGDGLDLVYAGSQKCLSCPPGLAPLTVSPRALEARRRRTTAVSSWFGDFELLDGYWGAGPRRTYHHTAPVNALYGLHEGLLALHEEGLETAWQRHRHHHLALAAGLEALGLRFVVPVEERLPQLNAVWIPDGIDDAAIRSRLLAAHGLEIGGGLGDLAGRAWRIGLMGSSATTQHVMACLSALSAEFARAGRPTGDAEQAARTVYGA